MDTKSLERTISTQQEEIDRLRKELKQQKERNSNIERVERWTLYVVTLFYHQLDKLSTPMQKQHNRNETLRHKSSN